jgi:hypothetical protein
VSNDENLPGRPAACSGSSDSAGIRHSFFVPSAGDLNNDKTGAPDVMAKAGCETTGKPEMQLLEKIYLAAVPGLEIRGLKSDQSFRCLKLQSLCDRFRFRNLSRIMLVGC